MACSQHRRVRLLHISTGSWGTQAVLPGSVWSSCQGFRDMSLYFTPRSAGADLEPSTGASFSSEGPQAKVLALRGGSSPTPCLQGPQGRSKCPCMSRAVLSRGPPRGSPASAWLSTSHSNITRWAEHRAEPGVMDVRETAEAVTAFLGLWEMNKCPDTDPGVCRWAFRKQ